MKMFLVHCGYYDSSVCGGLYEAHANFFVAAEMPAEARMRVKELEEFITKRMHVDGLQEIQVVNGFRIRLESDPELADQTILANDCQRELAPK